MDNSELRSQKVQQIINNPLSKLMRYGVITIILCLTSLFSVVYFLIYKKTVPVIIKKQIEEIQPTIDHYSDNIVSLKSCSCTHCYKNCFIRFR
jgi:hypothetical protein